MIIFDHVVLANEKNKRIDKLIVDLYPHRSRTEIQQWIKNKYITVNGLPVKANYKCQLTDKVNGSIPAETSFNIEPENISLTIVYEDQYLLVVNKPRGMVVHPTASHQSGTLVHALLYHCNELSRKAGQERPGIVHRLDKDTSGLLVIAKNDKVHVALAEQFANREVKRNYGAIVHGVIEHDSGTIDAPIGRDPNNRLRMGVVDEGKPAITHFQVMTRFKDYSHIECKLESGRMHQIRVHMDYIDHPIVGDPKYTNEKKTNIKGQALFAKTLEFNHPEKKESMQFEIQPPFEFNNLLMKMNKMS